MKPEFKALKQIWINVVGKPTLEEDIYLRDVMNKAGWFPTDDGPDYNRLDWESTSLDEGPKAIYQISFERSTVED